MTGFQVGTVALLQVRESTLYLASLLSENITTKL